jgi:hypothetical protein
LRASKRGMHIGADDSIPQLTMSASALVPEKWILRREFFS